VNWEAVGAIASLLAAIGVTATRALFKSSVHSKRK
jgi:hypothetical protein